MQTREEKRIAVLALLDAGKSINVIISNLGVSQSLVLMVKRHLAAGKDLQASPRKVKKLVLMPGVIGGIKK